MVPLFLGWMVEAALYPSDHDGSTAAGKGFFGRLPTTFPETQKKITPFFSIKQP